MSGDLGMKMHETPMFERGEDETGGPAFFWKNPWTGNREKVASLWWPTHPPEETEAVEQLFSELTLTRTQPALREAALATLRALDELEVGDGNTRLAAAMTKLKMAAGR
jgi:hypothetical protein